MIKIVEAQHAMRIPILFEEKNINEHRNYGVRFCFKDSLLIISILFL